MIDPAVTTTSAYRVQLAILTALIAVFYIFTLSYVPKGRSYLLISATIVLLASGLISRRLGYSAKAGLEMVGVFLLGSLVLFIPLAATAPIAGEAGVAAGLGLISAEGLWALHRYPDDRRAEEVSFRKFIEYGLYVSGGYVLLLVAWLFVSVLKNPTEAVDLGREFLWVAPSLLLAGLFVGAVLGRMRILARYPLGTMLIGFFLAAIIFAALVTPAYLLFGTIGAEEATFGELVIVGFGWAIAIGPPGAVGFKWSHYSRGWDVI